MIINSPLKIGRDLFHYTVLQAKIKARLASFCCFACCLILFISLFSIFCGERRVGEGLGAARQDGTGRGVAMWGRTRGGASGRTSWGTLGRDRRKAERDGMRRGDQQTRRGGQREAGRGRASIWQGEAPRDKQRRQRERQLKMNNRERGKGLGEKEFEEISIISEAVE